MLTCQVGKSIIDTFSYKDEKLREWSNKSMLKCPVCNSNMVYCHGDFKIPYFRHDKDSDCPDIYSEGMTEEHLKGVEVLYKWLKSQKDILNIELEKWIPETRQRPDIYFEMKENDEIKKYVIEFQCSPIATKYNERHDLYRLNNINDIWILGTEKYDINKFLPLQKYDINNQQIDEVRTKTIEREIKNNSSLIYLTKSNRLIKISKNFVKLYSGSNEKKTIFDFIIDTKLIKNCNIDDIKLNNGLYINGDNTDLKNKSDILQKYADLLNVTLSNNTLFHKEYESFIKVNTRHILLKIKERSFKEIYKSTIDTFSEEKMLNDCNKEIEIYKNKYEIYFQLVEYCKSLNKQFSIVNKNCKFFVKSKFDDNYYSIKFDSREIERLFYINKHNTKCTVESSYTKPFRGKRGGIGWNRIYYDKTMSKFEYEEFNINEVIKYISNTISDTLRKYKYSNYLK